MTEHLQARAAAFRALHDGGTFVMPNAWDPGTAKIMAAAGAKAIATTSAGSNFSAGHTDWDYSVPMPEMMQAYGAIAAAVEIPVNGDLENGYGDRPEDVADCIRQAIAAGMVGGGIEDHTGRAEQRLYDIELAVERIRAAREAGEASGIPFTLTGRAECYLVGHEDAFAESVRRLNRYREAGADCLYAPGPRDAETIAALVREVDGPINVVVGGQGGLSVAELADLGVRRISIGGSLARAALKLVQDATRQMLEEGRFEYPNQLSQKDLNSLMRGS